ncbi:MmyB family transcriptional regulator [Streptomyces thermoviolaceus]
MASIASSRSSPSSTSAPARWSSSCSGRRGPVGTGRVCRRWWGEHDVYQRTHGTTHLHHPLVGDLVQGYEAFAPVDDPEQTLGPATVEPGSPTAERLALPAGSARSTERSPSGGEPARP